MKNSVKILLSIPSVLVLFLVLYNFFYVGFDSEYYDLMFSILMRAQILLLISIIIAVVNVWRKNASASVKWTWTLLMILVLQPITVLIYLWAIEGTLKPKTEK